MLTPRFEQKCNKSMLQISASKRGLRGTRRCFSDIYQKVLVAFTEKHHELHGASGMWTGADMGCIIAANSPKREFPVADLLSHCFPASDAWD